MEQSDWQKGLQPFPPDAPALGPRGARGVDFWPHLPQPSANQGSPTHFLSKEFLIIDISVKPDIARNTYEIRSKFSLLLSWAGKCAHKMKSEEEWSQLHTLSFSSIFVIPGESSLLRTVSVCWLVPFKTSPIALRPRKHYRDIWTHWRSMKVSFLDWCFKWASPHIPYSMNYLPYNLITSNIWPKF